MTHRPRLDSELAASALGPGIAGGLIDAGVDLDAQAFGYAGWCVIWAVAYFGLQGTLGRRVAEAT